MGARAVQLGLDRINLGGMQIGIFVHGTWRIVQPSEFSSDCFSNSLAERHVLA